MSSEKQSARELGRSRGRAQGREGERRAAQRAADRPEPQEKRLSALTGSQRDSIEAQNSVLR